MKSMFVVYILECADSTLYIGSTNDLKRRLAQHNSAFSGARYTRQRRPVVLRYTEKLRTLSLARSREAKLKQLTRAQKLHLIESASKR